MKWVENVRMFRISRRVFQSLNPFERVRARTAVERLAPPKDFEASFAREKRRVDRYGRPCSAVVFEFGESSRSESGLLALVEKIKESKRTLDSVGWCRDGKIGVLLRDTDENAARTFSERIYHSVRSLCSPLSYKIVTYAFGSEICDSVSSHPEPERASAQKGLCPSGTMDRETLFVVGRGEGDEEHCS